MFRCPCTQCIATKPRQSRASPHAGPRGHQRTPPSVCLPHRRASPAHTTSARACRTNHSVRVPHHSVRVPHQHTPPGVCLPHQPAPHPSVPASPPSPSPLSHQRAPHPVRARASPRKGAPFSHQLTLVQVLTIVQELPPTIQLTIVQVLAIQPPAHPAPCKERVAARPTRRHLAIPIPPSTHPLIHPLIHPPIHQSTHSPHSLPTITRLTGVGDSGGRALPRPNNLELSLPPPPTHPPTQPPRP